MHEIVLDCEAGGVPHARHVNTVEYERQIYRYVTTLRIYEEKEGEGKGFWYILTAVKQEQEIRSYFFSTFKKTVRHTMWRFEHSWPISLGDEKKLVVLNEVKEKLRITARTDVIAPRHIPDILLHALLHELVVDFNLQVQRWKEPLMSPLPKGIVVTNP